MIGGEPCGSPELWETHKHLRRIVLVINFEDEVSARNASEFLRAVYGRFFLAVAIYGPSEIPDLQVESRGSRAWGRNSSFLYYSLPAVVAKYPEADGYLCIADDVVINYWQLRRADPSKLWLPDTPGCPPCRQGIVPYSGLREGWPMRMASVAQRRAVKSALWRIELPYREQFEQSLLPSEDVYPTRPSDVYYFPRRHAIALAFDLIPAFRDYGVFGDIAVPTMFYALEKPDQYDAVLAGMVYRGEEEGPFDASGVWNTSLSAFHFWKLASLAERAAFLRALSQADPCLQRLLQIASTISSQAA